MSSRLLRTAAAMRPGAIVCHQQPLMRRAIASSPQSRHKESSSHNHQEANIDKHKQDSLSKNKTGKGHWKPELASDSEEAVKADRTDADSGSKDDHIKKLQERTKRAAEETSKAGTSMRDGL